MGVNQDHSIKSLNIASNADKNIFSATKKIHHKKPTSQKITLQVNKFKTKFDALLSKFVETLKTKAQGSSETH